MSGTFSDWFRRTEPRRQVKGFLHDVPARAIAALLEVQQEHDVRGALGEIGVYHGAVLIGLARAARADERAVGIDPFAFGNESFAAKFKSNAASYLSPEQLDRLVAVRTTADAVSLQRWYELLRAPARFVHLDGKHTHENILVDMALATSSLAEGALVVLDDFLHEVHPDLTLGIIDALRATKKIRPLAVIPRMGSIYEGGSKLVCSTGTLTREYIAALDGAMQMRGEVVTLLGHPTRVYWPPQA